MTRFNAITAAGTPTVQKDPVDTIAALKSSSIAGFSGGETRFVHGYYAAGDGGGGVFRYNPSNATTQSVEGTIIAPNSGSGRWERIYTGDVWAKWFGAKFDGTTDDAAAINAANAVQSHAGTVLLSPGTTAIGSDVNFPGGSLIGSGSGKWDWGTKIKCLNSSARISFGALSGDVRGGASGGFIIDGNSVSANPLYIGTTVHRAFRDIDVVNAASGSAALLIQRAQNCEFDNVNCEDNAGDGLRIDQGAGGLSFARCSFNTSGAYNLRLTQSAASSDLYLVPSHIHFKTCLFEYLAAGTVGDVFIEAGDNITFDTCALSVGSPASPKNIVRTQQLSPYNRTMDIRFDNCVTWGGTNNNVTAYSIGAATSVKVDSPEGQSLLNLFALEVGAVLEYRQGLPLESVGSIFSGAGDPSQIPVTAFYSKIAAQRPTSSSPVLDSYAFGESGQRVQMTGTYMGFCSGSSFTADAYIQRAAGGMLNVGPALQIGLGDPIAQHLSGTTTWDPVSLAVGTKDSTTVTVTGAAVGDTVTRGFSQAIPAGFLLTADVTSANTVTAQIFNISGSTTDIASGTLRVDIWKH